MVTMKAHKILFSYTETVIPPRCRKPRPQKSHDGEVDIEIAYVSEEEAPIAIRSHVFLGYGEARRPFSVDYRWWQGSLWTAVRLAGVTPRGYTSRCEDWDYTAVPDVVDVRTDTAYPNCNVHDIHYYTAYSRAEVEKEVRDSVQSNLVVDGVWYRPAGEPRYVVQTFGLGNNHGGTAVFADSSYNSNVPHHRYFSLLDRDKALALATEIANKRGDDKSLPMKVNGDPEFEILLPESIQVRPADQHGNGDPFLNKLDGITEACGGSPVGGLMAAVLVASEAADTVSRG
jgi:hypothetical protein